MISLGVLRVKMAASWNAGLFPARQPARRAGVQSTPLMFAVTSAMAFRLLVCSATQL